ncbi:MAG: MFS transporter [Paracoccaceae bacterium]|nr:MFS transporter [Paracoccaceae bacterium]
MQGRSQTVFTPVLIAGSIILLVGFGIRASFGVFQIPIASEFGWPRADFSAAIAVQNLAWGIGQPIFAAIAEKFGIRLAIILGALVYALGLVWSSFAVTPLGHQMLEVLVGFGVAGTGFGVILAVVGRTASDEHRSLALGIATAAGSVGQIIGPPLAAILLAFMNWSMVFIVFAAIILAVLLTLPMLRGGDGDMISQSGLKEPLSRVLANAARDPSYTLIFLGFFSCGFQIAFNTAHFPAMVTEMCGPIASDGLLASIGIGTTSALGAVAIGLIGLTNVFGTVLAGLLGKTFVKKYLLVVIYSLRTVISILFIVFPITPLSVVLFSLAMGFLWLATVPLTSGLIAYIYGIRFMGTLYGIVFLSHQIGGFLGVWLGGALYDLYGNYTVVWWVGIGVAAFSAVVHLPVQESPLRERVAAAG